MSALSWDRVIASSANGARRLQGLGCVAVLVETPDGKTIAGRLKAAPFSAPNGGWFCEVEGIAGIVDCAFVQPIAKNVVEAESEVAA